MTVTTSSTIRGDDTLVGGNGNDHIRAEAGNDAVDAAPEMTRFEAETDRILSWAVRKTITWKALITTGSNSEGVGFNNDGTIHYWTTAVLTFQGISDGESDYVSGGDGFDDAAISSSDYDMFKTPRKSQDKSITVYQKISRQM